MGHALPGVVENDALTAPPHAPAALFQEPLVEAKLAAPYLRPAILPRAGLLQRLLRSDAGLVTMVAPPGYGKSTSLALWRAQEPRPVAWVTCDAADADPMRFLGYVGLAIERALDLGMPVIDRSAMNGGSALSNYVPRLTSALHVAERPMVLMVDDVHHLAGTPTADVLTMMIDYLPRGVTVAVAGRTDGGLPFGRMRASGAMLEIGIGDLALDEHEAGRLAALAGRELRPPEARDLHARTEGWPAAVYLAARRSRQPSANREAGAPRVSGRDSDIGDYLDAELLDHASPRVRSFLLKTAVLDRLTAAVCDAVVESKGSDRILRDLASTNQLVVPLDAHGGWYRYHTLLREHLLAILERDRQAAAAANRRAAAWFAENGMPELAVDHLFAAGDPDAAAAQACSLVPRLFRDGREVTFARWMNSARRRLPAAAALPGRHGSVDAHDPGPGGGSRAHGRIRRRRRIRGRSSAGRRDVRGGASVCARPDGARRTGGRRGASAYRRRGGQPAERVAAAVAGGAAARSRSCWAIGRKGRRHSRKPPAPRRHWAGCGPSSSRTPGER